MDVRLPKLGEGADSGTVVGILVGEGDTVTKGQTILELENEKAVAPIPSPADGKVAKIRVKEGDKISAGAVLMVLETAGGAASVEEKAEDAPKPKKTKAARVVEVVEEEEETTEETEEPAENVEVAAAPYVRKVARELGINLGRVKGTESGGRIGLGDLRAYVQRLIKLAAQPKAKTAATVEAAPARPAPQSIDFSQWGPVTKKPMTPLRQVISRRMVENWNAIPHVTQFDDIDITHLVDHRKKYAPIYEQQGARLTLTTFVLKAVVEALKKHPIFNASLDEATNEIVFKDYYHIGIAVDTEAGLLVPVIRDVDKKSLLQLSKDLDDIARRARDRKVSGEEMKGGTFTISNQGGIGGAHFTPIVNKPEVAILGLGRSVLKPVVVNGKIEPRMMMPVGLSYDHRLIDGGTAARFTVDLIAAFANFKEADVKL
ncbi:MAG: 2-oxo acid dehydrogenase subunit E2 [Verrucomicrobiota bacterium]